MGHYDVPVEEPQASMSIKMRPAGLTEVQCAGFYSSIRVVDPLLDVPTLVPFIPHTTHPANQVVCAMHRFGRKMKNPTKQHKELFLDYAKNLIQLIWTDDMVLRDEDVPSVVAWLEKANYTGSRKEQLLKLAADLERVEVEHATVESFVKQEGYFPKPKNARGINSPTDESKTILGPLFAAIDKATFKARFFVKGTNPRDWPAKILDLLGMDAVTETDFSAFESHHSGVFSEVTYYWMLHMMRNVSRISPMKSLVAKLVMGRHNIVFKHIKVETDQRLMSGALWTSSSNGILNLIIMSYLASLAQNESRDAKTLAIWTRDRFKGLVEGDDGLCLDYGIKQDDIDGLGIVLGMEPHKNFTEANFCGIVCDPDALVVLKDPIAAISKMFVLPPKYAQASDNKQRSLLRARAMSYLCNFSTTPVLASACHWVLRRTKGMNSCLAVLDRYHLEYAQIAERELKRNSYAMATIPLSSRLICEDRFGVPVCEQIRLERCFDDCDSDVCRNDFMPFTPDVVLDHALNFLYEPGTVPAMRPCEMPESVREVLESGKRAVGPSRKCAFVNARFRRNCPAILPVDLSTGLGD